MFRGSFNSAAFPPMSKATPNVSAARPDPARRRVARAQRGGRSARLTHPLTQARRDPAPDETGAVRPILIDEVGNPVFFKKMPPSAEPAGEKTTLRLGFLRFFRGI